ncbi:ubiquitin ligase protein chfr [Anaeramoeba flamelloides]|uniref:E3 ubiquitin-protein ligase CHFR n=1 Tax=Anaeramoeba flamelloides TaxID=1746091 RepID=A0AAV7YFI4_9EUKA|nr:ubiquitin ligase protein chfr [Anaeramoeba flamelloides]
MEQPLQEETLSLNEENEEEEALQSWCRLTSLNPKYHNIEVVEPKELFGRTQPCKHLFNFNWVSSQHFELRKETNENEKVTFAYLYDYSSNGTFVNKKRIGRKNKVQLKTGDTICLSVSDYKKTKRKEVKKDFIAFTVALNFGTELSQDQKKDNEKNILQKSESKPQEKEEKENNGKTKKKNLPLFKNGSNTETIEKEETNEKKKEDGKKEEEEEKKEGVEEKKVQLKNVEVENKIKVEVENEEEVEKEIDITKEEEEEEEEEGDLGLKQNNSTQRTEINNMNSKEQKEDNGGNDRTKKSKLLLFTNKNLFKQSFQEKIEEENKNLRKRNEQKMNDEEGSDLEQKGKANEIEQVIKKKRTNQNIVIQEEKPKADNQESKHNNTESKDQKAKDEDNKGSSDKLEENLMCSICHEIQHNPIACVPCMHSFCGGCITQWSDRSSDCPLCKTKIDSYHRNFGLKNILAVYLENHPDKKRDPEDIQELDENDTILERQLKKRKRRLKKRGNILQKDDDDDSDSSFDSDSDSDSDVGVNNAQPHLFGNVNNNNGLFGNRNINQWRFGMGNNRQPALFGNLNNNNGLFGNRNVNQGRFGFGNVNQNLALFGNVNNARPLYGNLNYNPPLFGNPNNMNNGLFGNRNINHGRFGLGNNLQPALFGNVNNHGGFFGNVNNPTGPFGRHNDKQLIRMNKCSECVVPRKDDNFKCDQNNPKHFVCHACNNFFADRNDPKWKIECEHCKNKFCNNYRENGCKCKTLELKKIKEHQFKILPMDCFNNNRYERQILHNYLEENSINIDNFFQDLLKNLDSKTYSKDDLNTFVGLKSDSFICTVCFKKLANELIYAYRANIPPEKLPKKVTTRGDCWYGKLCRTQSTNYNHATKLNHICKQTKH